MIYSMPWWSGRIKNFYYKSITSILRMRFLDSEFHKGGPLQVDLGNRKEKIIEDSIQFETELERKNINDCNILTWRSVHNKGLRDWEIMMTRIYFESLSILVPKINPLMPEKNIFSKRIFCYTKQTMDREYFEIWFPHETRRAGFLFKINGM